MKAFLISVHALMALIWVGGMIFAYSFQRPAAGSQLQAPERLRLWLHTFLGFFPWVWAAVILLPLTGYAVIFLHLGGMAGAPLYVHLMNGLGLLMILIFLHVYFAPFRKLRRAVTAEDWQEGGRQLARIRFSVAVNLTLGVIVFVVAVAGHQGLWVLV